MSLNFLKIVPFIIASIVGGFVGRYSALFIFTKWASNTPSTVSTPLHDAALIGNKEKIFSVFNENTLNQLINLSTIENNYQHGHILKKLQTILLNHCKQTKIKSPFINQILEEKLTLINTNIFSKVNYINRTPHIYNLLELIKDMKAHLEYIFDISKKN